VRERYASGALPSIREGFHLRFVLQTDESSHTRRRSSAMRLDLLEKLFGIMVILAAAVPWSVQVSSWVDICPLQGSGSERHM